MRRADSHISAKIASPNPHASAGSLAVHPVHGDAVLDAHHQFVRNHPQDRFSHHLPCALVLGQSVTRQDGRFLRPALVLPSLASWISSSMTSAEARICSYECTFCADCVETKLNNVCPNCGGGFVPRPVRPATEWRPGVSVKKRPPSTKRIHLSYSLDDITRHTARTFPVQAALTCPTDNQERLSAGGFCPIDNQARHNVGP